MRNFSRSILLSSLPFSAFTLLLSSQIRRSSANHSVEAFEGEQIAAVAEAEEEEEIIADIMSRQDGRRRRVILMR
jgi:hypothetical protein